MQDNGRCGCGRRIDAGSPLCTSCERPMFWEYEHMRAKLPVDVYVEEEVGWTDLDEPDEDA